MKTNNNSAADSYGSNFSKFSNLKTSYADLVKKNFSEHPSKEFNDLIQEFFLTRNNKTTNIDKLISKEYQLLYLQKVRNLVFSYNNNLNTIKNNKAIVDYKYDFNESNDLSIKNIMFDLEELILEIPLEFREEAKSSLNSLSSACQLRYIRLETRLMERTLPLLKNLERELSFEIPKYYKIGLIEKKCLELLFSFINKTNEVLAQIYKEESLLRSYKTKE